MTKSTLSERFADFMWPRVKAFRSDVSGLDTSGIPEPHLPHWGIGYETASPKIGVIGRDTRGWGDMARFLEAVEEGDKTAIFKGPLPFDRFDFTKWTNNFGKSFWDTSLKIIAGVNGVHDWKALKRREIVEPMQNFFWANANSVERFESSPKPNGVEWDTWLKVKQSSEKHLDSLRLLLDTFSPDIVFLMNWGANEQFIDCPLEWTEFGNHLAEATDSKTGCLVLATAHPTWLNRNKLYEEAISGVIQRANKSLQLTARNAAAFRVPSAAFGRSGGN